MTNKAVEEITELFYSRREQETLEPNYKPRIPINKLGKDLEKKVLDMYYSRKGIRKSYTEREIVNEINTEIFGLRAEGRIIRDIDLKTVSRIVRSKKSRLKKYDSLLEAPEDEALLKRDIYGLYSEIYSRNSKAKTKLKNPDLIRKVVQEFRKTTGYNLTQKHLREIIRENKDYAETPFSDKNSACDTLKYDILGFLESAQKTGANELESYDKLIREFKRASGFDITIQDIKEAIKITQTPVRYQNHEQEMQEDYAIKIKQIYVHNILQEKSRQIKEKTRNKKSLKTNAIFGSISDFRKATNYDLKEDELERIIRTGKNKAHLEIPLRLSKEQEKRVWHLYEINQDMQKLKRTMESEYNREFDVLHIQETIDWYLRHPEDKPASYQKEIKKATAEAYLIPNAEISPDKKETSTFRVMRKTKTQMIQRIKDLKNKLPPIDLNAKKPISERFSNLDASYLIPKKQRAPDYSPNLSNLASLTAKAISFILPFFGEKIA